MSNNKPEKMTLDEFLEKQSLESPISNFMTDKIKGNRQLRTEKGYRSFQKRADAERDLYHKKREEAIAQYYEAVKNGEIIPKTEIEKTIEKAQGHPDNESTQAARRMCAKRGYDWQTGQKFNDSVPHTRIFIDMDGVLAYFNNNIESEEVLYQQGYFRNLLPQDLVLTAVNQLIDTYPDQCYILSAAVDSPYAIPEKMEWLHTYVTSSLKEDHIIFTKCGEDKSKFIKNGITEKDILLDDYNKNLREFQEAGGIGIKLVNNINNRNHSWEGARIHYQEVPENQFRKLEAYLTQEIDQEQMQNINETVTLAIPIKFA